MIVGIKGIQDCGKTAIAVATIFELVAHHGYQWSEVVSNILIRRQGVNCVTNEVMRTFITRMVSGGIKHKIILIDEADRIFPSRFWQDREQSDALIGLWQDVKLFNWIIYTAHIGTSVDIMLRQTTQIGIIPLYVKGSDLIKFTIFNALYQRTIKETAENVSKTIFPYYDRWEPVKPINA